MGDDFSLEGDDYDFEKDDGKKKQKKEKKQDLNLDDELSADYGEEGEEGMEEMGEDELNEYGEDECGTSKDESELDAMLQEREEDEFGDLKLPSDLDGEDENDEDYDDENDGGAFGEDPEGPVTIEKDGKKGGKKEEYGDEDGPSDAEDDMNEVFAAARENKEMDYLENMRRNVEQGEGFVNEDLCDKINAIEDEMMNPKSWQMLGEARAGERPTNSLVDCHLDFNTATKAPTVITKETTTAIETLIKQRILDELFDDPILREATTKKRKLDSKDNEMDFTKSKKGLGDIYADNMSKKLMEMNQEAFLETALSGPDAPLKREIEDISRDLFN